MANQKAKEPFRFFTRLHLKELTGLKATDLPTLVSLIQTVPGSSIYYHTHHFLQQHQFLSPEPPNDFAYWVSEALGEDPLGEKLASIDTVQFHTIRALREKLAETIESHLKTNPRSAQRTAPDGEPFYFMKSVSFILPTPYTATTLKEFAEILKKISVYSLYFHIFEARLRLEQPTNDFALWLKENLKEEKLAQQVEFLDPYTHTLESLRGKLIALVEKRITANVVAE